MSAYTRGPRENNNNYSNSSHFFVNYFNKIFRRTDPSGYGRTMSVSPVDGRKGSSGRRVTRSKPWDSGQVTRNRGCSIVARGSPHSVVHPTSRARAPPPRAAPTPRVPASADRDGRQDSVDDRGRPSAHRWTWSRAPRERRPTKDPKLSRYRCLQLEILPYLSRTLHPPSVTSLLRFKVASSPQGAPGP